MNWRNPITDLMIPNTGSGVCLRRASRSCPLWSGAYGASLQSALDFPVRLGPLRNVKNVG